MKLPRLTAIAVVLAASTAFAEQAGFFHTSIVCGTESRHGWSQIFAETGDGWKRFDALANLPPETNSRPVAKIWKGPFGNMLVLITRSQPSLTTQTTYCFQADGLLLALDHQVHTGWGWAFSRTQRYQAGALSSTFYRFVDLKNGAEVTRPAKLKHMKETAGALDPPAYASFADLPFAQMFHPLKDSESY